VCSFNLSLCWGLGLTFHTIKIKIKCKHFRNLLLLFYARVLITFLVIFHILLNRAVGLYVFDTLYMRYQHEISHKTYFQLKMKYVFIVNFVLFNFLRAFFIVLRADGLIQVETCNSQLKQLTALTIKKFGANFVWPTILLHRFFVRRSSYSFSIVILFHRLKKNFLLANKYDL
jgi:hypothetical protein